MLKDDNLTRKLDHLQLAKSLADGPMTTGFEDIYLIHRAASCLSVRDIDTGFNFVNKKLEMPLLINAITGGPELSTQINGSLARVAKELGIGMAVGSQRLALSNPVLKSSYTIARKENPHGLIFANLGALCSPDEALQAVEMLEADGLQLHLNLAQELAMAEGDRNFNGITDNIAAILQKVPVPVIVKEVGFGLSAETAQELWQMGVTYMDVGGRGGTNFATIERYRQGQALPTVFEDWGMPTAVSIAEVTTRCLPITVIASGGIRSALEAIKALSLGADLIGIAGPAVKYLMDYSEEDLLAYFRQFIYDFRSLMVLTGSANLDELPKLPIIFTGKTKEWLEQRGIMAHYKQRTLINPEP
jgi:isopentenyl-diphosphate delta-isomerase